MSKPGEWWSTPLCVLVAALLCWYLIGVRTRPQGALAALDLNKYNLVNYRCVCLPMAAEAVCARWQLRPGTGG